MSPSSRRAFLMQAAATCVAVRTVAAPSAANRPSLPDVREAPGTVVAFTETGMAQLTRNGRTWSANDGTNDLEVRFEGTSAVNVFVHAPGLALMRLHVRWRGGVTPGLAYLGDHWERSYGDLGWRGLDPERTLPWYLLASKDTDTIGVGVKTGPGSFCYWQVDEAGLSLVLDVRSGGRGVLLGSRELHAATLVTQQYAGKSAFTAARDFCRKMCDAPRFPKSPLYGGNNWYYAYGKSSADDIRRDSERVASWAPKGDNRPFMVIDDGWEPYSVRGPWDHGNERFPDMPGLSVQMKRLGVRPGIWCRPLFTKEAVPEGWKLQSPGAREGLSKEQTATLDPTVPEVTEQITKDVGRLAGWGYELIKHDFSTYDLLGRWGFAMGSELTDAGWSFADRTRTNAEITTALYKTLRLAAGSVMILGCNTVGHLGAGIFEAQRTGDDTSGREWSRTRKMGINTLAFRGPQHETFFAIDADCVGLTRQVPWEENRQWLDLLARSGTPLLVSAAPDAMKPEQEAAVREAFAQAAVRQPLGEPLDWMETTQPARWKLDGKTVEYRWFLD